MVYYKKAVSIGQQRLVFKGVDVTVSISTCSIFYALFNLRLPYNGRPIMSASF